MGQTQSHHHVARPDYPYGSAPLLPQWGGCWARGLSLLIIACAGYSTVVHGADWSIDRIALLIILPALLGITLAFAPDPPSFVSRLAKRLTTAGCAVGTMKSRVSRARSELQNMLDRGDVPAWTRDLYNRDLEHLEKAA